uniref:ATP-dependent zinc protease family protein n=1 Tax=Thaumasiovibrio occultus TaxID=1891184 RepID=UPI000B35FFF2|nr:RimK/LysX family protein [Thaumasiovibrio occultus]
MTPLKKCLLSACLAATWSASAATTSTATELFSHPTTIDGRVVLGRTESLYFNNIPELNGVEFPAKIDTGADSTSIHAENIRIVPTDPQFADLEGDALIEAIMHEYNKVRRVQLKNRDDLSDIQVYFDIRHPYTGEAIPYQADLLRIARVKSREDGYLYRPVVVMPLTIGGVTVNTEVNLTDRQDFTTPVLVGKTFLSDHAWVDAGYDYFQSQRDALVIGREERGEIAGLPVNIHVSLHNRYSALHASKISVDQTAREVSFVLENQQGQQQAMTAPLVRLVPFASGRKPLVYLPLRLGSEGANPTEEHILVYLTNRKDEPSELRLGLETLSRLYVVDGSTTGLAEKPLETLTQRAEQGSVLVIGTQETMSINGVEVIAEPSLTVKTSVLEVPALAVNDDEVEYQIQSVADENVAFSDEVVSRLKVGEVHRWVIDASLQFHHLKAERRVALQLRDSRDTEPSVFNLSPSMVAQPLLINTRSTDIFHKVRPVETGVVEQVTIGDLQFPAKLDTGADMSSISATNIERFERDGRDWVRFDYSNRDGLKHTFERPVVHTYRVKAREGESTATRLVVKLPIQMGEIAQTIRVNLRDRTDFDYSLILGQNFLNDNIVVNAGKTFLYTEAESGGD